MTKNFWTVRECKLVVRKLNDGSGASRWQNVVKLAEMLGRSFASIETRIRLLQTKGTARGKIEIEYYSSADLERIVQLLVNR